MSTRGCRAEAVILETLVSWSLSQVGIEKFRTSFVVFPDAAEYDWNKAEIDWTLGIWIFFQKKHVSFFGELFWLKISKLATANVRELHFRKQSFLRSHFPEESLYFNPHKLAMFDPRRSHTRLWSWLKRCLEAGEWFKEVGSLKAFSERLPKIHMFFSWFKEIQGDSIWWMFCHLSKRGLWSVISEALALRLELEAPPLEEVGGWSIDLNRSSLNKNRNKFQGRRFVITQNQRRGRIYTFQKCFCFRSRSQISSFS